MNFCSGVQEASFKAFLQQPGNKAVVEAHQEKEALRSLKAQERHQSRAFRAAVRMPGALAP